MSNKIRDEEADDIERLLNLSRQNDTAPAAFRAKATSWRSVEQVQPAGFKWSRVVLAGLGIAAALAVAVLVVPLLLTNNNTTPSPSPAARNTIAAANISGGTTMTGANDPTEQPTTPASMTAPTTPEQTTPASPTTALTQPVTTVPATVASVPTGLALDTPLVGATPAATGSGFRSGTLQNYDTKAGTLTITGVRGTFIAKINPATTITRLGQTRTTSDIKIGEVVTVYGVYNSQGQLEANFLDLNPAHVEREINPPGFPDDTK